MPSSGVTWTPDDATIAHANITHVAAELGLSGLADLHRWSVESRSDFWDLVADRLGVVFATRPNASILPDSPPNDATWFPGARLNIVASCFNHDPDRVALVTDTGDGVEAITYGELSGRVARCADGLSQLGVQPGQRVAIAMPMMVEAVVAYLATIATGAVVVSIADSFASAEIASRLRITDTHLVVTQDRIVRGGKELPMYAKILDAGAGRAIVVETGAGLDLRPNDIGWSEMQGSDSELSPVIVAASTHSNILFSSGTTGEPKAIPWSHITPLKAAMDAHFHQDVHTDDVLAWPTNLGWMMGPWLIYAALLNGAAFALSSAVPTSRTFAEFVEAAGVTMLGVVPSLVGAWRASDAITGLDWSAIQRFSSTGEVSNADDMAWLMAAAGSKPVLEYCGGTEIGGGYVCGSMVQPAVPGTFTTAALGLDLRILDEAGSPVTSGEVFLVPPSIGLSTELLNQDHDDVYDAGATTDGVALRRHGDHMEQIAGGYYRALGRIDDTMNLGGIKIGSAEIERVVGTIAGVVETAAIAVSPPGGGPSQLVVFAVPSTAEPPDLAALKEAMQDSIRMSLNPLFKIHEVVPIEALPRTASHKVMRRELRRRYQEAAR